MLQPVSIFWFRRDLRLRDNHGLYQALRSGLPVIPVFIFDRSILDDLEDKEDRRVCFIHDSLEAMQTELTKTGSSLHVLHDTPEHAFEVLTKIYSVAAVYTNHDYEPYARGRDERVAALLHRKGVCFYSFKDQVIFEKDEVVKQDGSPYTVFTPYSRKWKLRLNEQDIPGFRSEGHLEQMLRQQAIGIPSLTALGFRATAYEAGEATLVRHVAHSYNSNKDIPGVGGTTRLSVHLRFGTISIRELMREAITLNETLVNELIWREFYQMLLYQFPGTVSQSFRPAYDQIKWRNKDAEFERWCQGMAGYAMVDAGMRQLNETGWMHNRVRMITASFLCKHLLIDWRWGEAYFAAKLLDYDMASNIGNWQWAAGSGADAAPYFRVFNPYTQQKKFDPELSYVRRWVPEYGAAKYPEPMVDHVFARERCLSVYREAVRDKA